MILYGERWKINLNLAPYAVRNLSPAEPTHIHALPNAERRCTGNVRAKQLDARQANVDLSIITNTAGCCAATQTLNQCARAITRRYGD